MRWQPVDCLSREKPLAATFDSILHGTPVAPEQLNPEVPLELVRIVGKCLEKDRDLRYQHASEVSADLKRLKRDLQITSVPAVSTALELRAVSNARKHRLLFGIAALCSVLVITAALSLLRSRLLGNRERTSRVEALTLITFTSIRVVEFVSMKSNRAQQTSTCSRVSD